MEVLVDDKGLSLRLDQAPDVVGAELLRTFRRIGQKYETTIKGDFLSGQMLTPRTGAGRRSIFHRIEAEASGDAGDIVVIVGADLGTARYMRLQALGGIIRPKRGTYLAIPIGEAKTASGVARFAARDVMADPGSFGYKSTFVHNHMIFGVKDRRGRAIGTVVPLFVLRTSVTIPARNYLIAARDRLTTFVAEQAAGIGKKAVEFIVSERGTGHAAD